jgi:putative FmdB family regulatory protein
MPTYDFRCQDCLKKFSIFLSYQEYDKADIHCSHCGSANVQRKIGKIRIARSEESRLDAFPDTPMPSMGNNPQDMGRMMRQMSQEVGEPMPDEFNEVVGRLERGESPDSIEKSMPDLGKAMEDAGD